MEKITAKVDIGETIKYYEQQIQFVDGCTCKDCAYYQNEFLQTHLSIFKSLNEFGVDLRKNIDNDSDPEGLWVVMDKGIMVYCHSAYNLIGNFINEKNDSFEITENDFQITIQFFKANDTCITLFLTFRHLNEQ